MAHPLKSNHARRQRNDLLASLMERAGYPTVRTDRGTEYLYLTAARAFH